MQSRTFIIKAFAARVFTFQRQNPPPSLTTAMFKCILLLVAVSGSIALAAGNPSPSSSPTANPPTEASIKELLQVAQARKLVDSVMAQMDNLMQQAIADAVHGQKIPEKVQKQIDQNRSEMRSEEHTSELQ